MFAGENSQNDALYKCQDDFTPINDMIFGPNVL